MNYSIPSAGTILGSYALYEYVRGSKNPPLWWVSSFLGMD
jgi:hypothetical protein